MELFHALNRGVDGRKIFLDTQDYARFAHDLYEFNDVAPAPEYNRRDLHVGLTKSYMRKRLVEIHGWVLMENHYHLLLSELVEGGLVLFLRKLNIGYARYFNDRYERKGALFQGRTKKIVLKEHEHFLYILHYIHLNPLDYLEGAQKWRERDKGDISNVQEALEYLKNYRWSSYLDYSGTRNFPSILTIDLFKNALDDYASDLKNYLQTKEAYDLNSLES
jgi:putative transposase